MDRVLSFRPHRGCNGQSDFVRKSFCISIVFVVGFMCVFGGFFMGRVSMQHEYLLKNNRYLYEHRNDIYKNEDISHDLNILSGSIVSLLNSTSFLKHEETRKDIIRDIVEAFICKNNSRLNNTELIIASIRENVQRPEDQLLYLVRDIIRENIYLLKACFENAKTKIEFINL